MIPSTCSLLYPFIHLPPVPWPNGVALCHEEKSVWQQTVTPASCREPGLKSHTAPVRQPLAPEYIITIINRIFHGQHG